MTRREILRLFAVAGGGAVAGSATAWRGEARPAANADAVDLDVAIVGAGVSGVYTAWRLANGGSSQSPMLHALAAARRGRLAVGVFESSGRTGGRICSLRPDGLSDVRAELGGMRFPTTHTLVRQLVQHLRLSTQPFPVTEGANLHYLRGRRIRADEWSVPGRLPYQLREQEAGKSLDDLLIDAIERVVPDARALDADGWSRLKTISRGLAGGHLGDVGFQNALLRTTSHEALSLIRDAGGYGSFYASWNAAEMTSWIMADFLGAPKYLTLTDGYDALPRTMASQFEAAGGVVSHGFALRRVRRDESAMARHLLLDFVDPDGHTLPVVRARHVVLAMPRRALELLERDTILNGSAQYLADLASVTPQPAGKVYLAYPDCWWRSLGISAGRSTTDLPIRQCYYFSRDPAGLLMASYHDDHDVPFWSALHPAMPRGMPFTTAPAAALVDEVQRQLREVHGPRASIPDPVWAVYANWSADPFGGGWHFWNPRSRPLDVMARMQQPLHDAPLYVCGEAWSTDQGWVRGALRTAEHLVQDKFGMPVPKWLPADEALRPRTEPLLHLEGVMP